ncbi:hypothetical protein GOD37_26360 [Sinorhizobium medicae]|nr:hypothetical protein [Sinorhizobium medicae]
MAWTISDIAAFYAAVVATGALFLEVRRWFESGVRLRLSANYLYAMGTPTRHEPMIGVEVSNIGDQPTTLTSMEIRIYRSKLHKILGQHKVRAAIIDPSGIGGYLQALPHIIEPGKLWRGGFEAESSVFRDHPGVAYAAVHTSRRKKPFLVRLKI